MAYEVILLVSLSFLLSVFTIGDFSHMDISYFSVSNAEPAVPSVIPTISSFWRVYLWGLLLLHYKIWNFRLNLFIFVKIAQVSN